MRVFFSPVGRERGLEGEYALSSFHLIGDIRKKDEYRGRYSQLVASRGDGFMTVKDVGPFGNAVIRNDYETFAEKVYHTVRSL